MADTVIVLAGSAHAGRASLRAVPDGARVVAADSGADLALSLGLHVDVAVGDFDSLAPEALAALERAGTRIERHPAAKDATDLQLALDTALTFGPRRVLVIGVDGGRLDHLLGELLLLGAEAYGGVEVDAHLGPALAHVVRGERVLAGTRGEVISLFALNGAAVDVVTDGSSTRFAARPSSLDLAAVSRTSSWRLGRRSGCAMASSSRFAPAISSAPGGTAWSGRWRQRPASSTSRAHASKSRIAATPLGGPCTTSSCSSRTPHAFSLTRPTPIASAGSFGPSSSRQPARAGTRRGRS